MSSKSNGKPRERTVRRTAGTLSRRTTQRLTELKQLAARGDDRINVSDVPEQDATDGRWVRGGHRVGGIRGAIVLELGRRGLTRYQFWKQARQLCPKLSSSAVYEYMDGRRQIRGEYIEAMLEALGLEVRPKAMA